MNTTHHTRRRTIAAILVATSLAAWSDGAEADAATESDSTQPSTPPTTAGGVDRADATVEEFLQQPTSIGVSEPLSTVPAGATVYWLEQGIPIAQLTGDALAEAADAAGVELVRVPAGRTPPELASAFDRAVADKPDAVIASGVNAALVSNQLQALAHAGVPVIVWGSPDETDPATGLTLNLEPPERYAFAGRMMADWVASRGAGAATTVFVNIPDFPVLNFTYDGFAEEYATTCPGCSVDTLDVKITDIGTQVPSALVSYLQANPSTDWVVLAVGDLGIGVPAALESAGLSEQVRITGRAGGAVNYQALMEGQQDSDIGFPAPLVAWKALDAAMRAIVGDDLAADGDPVPRQYLTADNLPFDPAETQQWWGVEDYREQFKVLWGVS